MTPRPTRTTSAGRAYLALRRLASEQGRTTAELLQMYALEAFLARTPASPHAHRFTLKGGLLLAAFDVRRPTRDVDLSATAAADLGCVLECPLLRVPNHTSLVLTPLRRMGWLSRSHSE